MNTSIKFSHKGYRDLLKKIIKKRKAISFSKYKTFKSSFIIIRHDIEFFVSSAYELAKIEKSLGVKSTFFFLFNSNYNIFSEHNFKLINLIKKMGHDFGIHYDANFLNENKINFNKNLKLQISLFESFFKVKIKAISCHRPKIKFSKYNDKKIINVYDKKFQKRVKYFSDSQQVFRENVQKLIDSDKDLHLLVHDYTWSKGNQKWEKNIIKFSKMEYEKNQIYLKNITIDWQIGLKKRKKMDSVFKRKILS